MPRERQAARSAECFSRPRGDRNCHPRALWVAERMRISLAVAAAAALAAATSVVLSPLPVAATAITPNGSWPTYHRDDAHTGFDPSPPTAVTASIGWTATLD